MDATVSLRNSSSVFANRAQKRTDSNMQIAPPQQALPAVLVKHAHLEFSETQDVEMLRSDGDADRDDVVALRKGPRLFDDHAEPQELAPGELAQVMADPYPPAFDGGVMRWVPVVVPLMGVFLVLLTGLMWTVVG